MLVQRYQTLQTDPANPVARPYFLEPQLNILGFRPNVMKTDVAVIGQFTRFVNPDKIQADRAVLYPQISLPIVHPAFQITPKVGLHMTQYSLSNIENFAMNGMTAAPPESASRTLPVLSLDSTVVFERESKILDLDYIQTLEPRLYYVNIPFNGLVLPKTYADAAIEYDYDLNQVDRFSLGARFQPDFGKVISASYRYTRDPLSLLPQVDQIDIAAQWPLSARWYGVGRYNYSLRDNQPLEVIAGLEYNAGCWALRSVIQRLSAVSSTTEPNTSFFVQLELNDLGSIGSNPIGLLRRTIPGYGKINELPNSGSLLSTP
jgi:lipopolysaccharide assembly outer membrane protein LptD (OstA)